MVEDYLVLLIMELNLQRLRKPYIVVEFVAHSDVWGYCTGDKDSATITISKTNPVTGERCGFIEMMSTLAHEMVHAKQFLRGELIAEPNWQWKGRAAKNYRYKNQPWEREAFRLEHELYRTCFPSSKKFSN